MPLTKAFREH